MSYEAWNLKKAKRQRRYLMQKNVDGKYNLDIDLINQVIDNSLVPFEYFLSLQEKLNFDKSKLDEYSYFFKIIEDFYHLTSKVKPGYLYEIDLPVNELLVFVNDFFKENLPNWYGIFEEVYKERKNNFKLGDKRCYELYIPALNYSYINFQKKLTVEDLFAIVHEYTHAVVDRIKFRYSYDNKYPFVELPPLTSELIAGDIMRSYYTNLDEEIENYYIGSVASLHDYADEIIKVKRFIDTFSIDDDEQIKYNIEHYTNNAERLKNPITNKLQLENICYVVPFIYAVELYFVYIVDKELFQYDINKIITMDNCSNYYEEIKKLGLTPNKNMKKFVESIKRG